MTTTEANDGGSHCIRYDPSGAWWAGWHSPKPLDQWWLTRPNEWRFVGWERWTLSRRDVLEAYYRVPNPSTSPPGTDLRPRGTWHWRYLTGQWTYLNTVASDSFTFLKGDGKGKGLSKGKGKFIDEGKGVDKGLSKGKGKDTDEGKGLGKGKGKSLSEGLSKGKGKDAVGKGKGKGALKGKGKGHGKGHGKGKGKMADEGEGVDLLTA